jgi:hypothetical protein
VTAFAVGALRLIAGGRGGLKSFPFSGTWTSERDLPVPEGRTFMQQIKSKRGKNSLS